MALENRIIGPGERYYAGGTVPKTAGSNGVSEPLPMAAAQYSCKTSHTGCQETVIAGLSGMSPLHEVPASKIYRGGTAG